MADDDKMEAALLVYSNNPNRTSRPIFISVLTGNATKKLKYKFTQKSIIRDIKQAYIDEVNNDKQISSMNLKYRGIALEDNKTFKLSGIKRSCTVILANKLRGGAAADDDQKYSNNNNARALDLTDPDIKLSKKACCMYGFDDNDGVQRAAMPCGCAICPAAMFKWVKTIYGANDNDYEINCPKCKTEWDWDLCTRIAVMNDKEFEYYDGQYSKRSAPESISCPNKNCGEFCERPDNLLMFRVNCGNCNGQDFCWNCAKPWRSSSLAICGNAGCITAEINEDLRSCALKDLGKDYGNVKVPEIRACIKCFHYIEHSDACKHMKCPECKQEFCFSCLKARNSDGSWPCGEYYNMCSVTARQQLK